MLHLLYMRLAGSGNPTQVRSTYTFQTKGEKNGGIFFLTGPHLQITLKQVAEISVSRLKKKTKQTKPPNSLAELKTPYRSENFPFT